MRTKLTLSACFFIADLKNIFLGLLKACKSDHEISTLKKLSTQFSIKV